MPFENLLRYFQPIPETLAPVPPPEYVPDNVIQQMSEFSAASIPPQINYNNIFGGAPAAVYPHNVADEWIQDSLGGYEPMPTGAVSPAPSFRGDLTAPAPVDYSESGTQSAPQMVTEGSTGAEINGLPDQITDFSRMLNRNLASIAPNILKAGAYITGNDAMVKDLVGYQKYLDEQAKEDYAKYGEGTFSHGLWQGADMLSKLMMDIVLFKGAGGIAKTAVQNILSRTGASTAAAGTKSALINRTLESISEFAYGMGAVKAADTWINTSVDENKNIPDRLKESAKEGIKNLLIGTFFEKIGMVGAFSPAYAHVAKQFLAQLGTMTVIDVAEKNIEKNLGSQKNIDKALENLATGNFSDMIELPTMADWGRNIVMSAAFSSMSGHGSMPFKSKQEFDAAMDHMKTFPFKAAEHITSLYDLKPTGNLGADYLDRSKAVTLLNANFTTPELMTLKALYPKGEEGRQGRELLDKVLDSKEGDDAEAAARIYTSLEAQALAWQQKASSPEATAEDRIEAIRSQQKLEGAREASEKLFAAKSIDPNVSPVNRTLYKQMLESMQSAKFSHFSGLLENLNNKIRNGGDYLPEVDIIRSVYGMSEMGAMGLVSRILGSRAFEQNARELYPRDLHALYDIMVDKDINTTMQSLREGIVKSNKESGISKTSEVGHFDYDNKSFTVKTTRKDGSVLEEVWHGLKFLSESKAQVSVEARINGEPVNPETGLTYGVHEPTKKKGLSNISIHTLPHASLAEAHFTMYHERLGHFLKWNNVITEDGYREIVKHIDAIYKNPRTKEELLKTIGMDDADFKSLYGSLKGENERFALGVQYLMSKRDFIRGNELVGLEPSAFYRKVMYGVENFFGKAGDALFGNERNAQAVIRRITSKNQLEEASRGLLGRFIKKDRTMPELSVPVPTEAEYRSGSKSQRPYQISVEATPSKSTAFGEWLEKQSWDIKKYYFGQTAAIADIGNNGGILAKMLGLDPSQLHVGEGIWGKSVNPSMQMRIGRDADINAVKALADAHGLLYNQDAVGWHKLIEPASMAEGDASLVQKMDGKPLTAVEQKAIIKALEEWGFPSSDIAPISEKNGGVFLYFGDKREDFNHALNEVAQDYLYKNFKSYSAWRSENGLQEAASGTTDYASRLREFGRPDIERHILEVLAPQIREIQGRVGRQYGYKEPEPVFTKEQEQAHLDEAKRLTTFEGKPTFKGKGQLLIIVGGLPGAGKSTSMKGIPKDILDVSVVANPDLEARFIGGDRVKAHKQASELAKKRLREATEKGNIAIYDGVGGNFNEAVRAIETVKKNGGRIMWNFIDTTPEISRANSDLRYSLGVENREVPDYVIAEGHNRGVPTLLEAMKKYADDPQVEFNVYSNNIVGGAPTKIIEGNKIHDAESWKKIEETGYERKGDKVERTPDHGRIEAGYFRESGVGERVNRIKDTRSPVKSDNAVRVGATEGGIISLEDLAINQDNIKKSFAFDDHNPTPLEKSGYVEHIDNNLTKEFRVAKLKDIKKLSDLFEDQSLTPFLKHGLNGLEISKEQLFGKFGKMSAVESFEANVRYLQHFVDQIVVAARLGMGNKDWWLKGGGFINDMFGNYHREGGNPNVDPVVFSGFIASTSMNKEVRPNLRMALGFMREYLNREDSSPFEWQALGKTVEDLHALQKALPPNKSITKKDVARMLEKNGIDPAISHNAGAGEVYNAYRVLEQARLLNERNITPEELALGGEKISAMWQNLMGSTSKVCNDTWNTRLVGLLKYSFDPKLGKYKLEQDLGTGNSYTALSVAIANAAKKLGITPAETQSALWGFTKGIIDIAESSKGTYKDADGNLKYKSIQQLLDETTVSELADRFSDLSSFAVEGYDYLLRRRKEIADGTYDPNKPTAGVDTEGIANEIEALGLEKLFAKHYKKYTEDTYPEGADRPISEQIGSGRTALKAYKNIGKNFQSFVEERRRLSAEKMDAFAGGEKPVRLRYSEYLTRKLPIEDRAFAEDLGNPEPLYIGSKSMSFRLAQKEGKLPEKAFSSLVDRMPRMEIDDSLAKLKVQSFVQRPSSSGESTYEYAGKLGGIFEHPQLMREYPSDKMDGDIPIRDADVRIFIDPNGKFTDDGSGVRGEGSHKSFYYFNGSIEATQIDVHAPSVQEAKAVLLHEVQHAIQDREDFARGGNKYMVSGIRGSMQEEILSVAREKSPEFAAGLQAIQDNASKQFLTWKDVLPDVIKLAKETGVEPIMDDYMRVYGFDNINELYRSLGGEMESNDVLLRANLSAVEREAVPPMQYIAEATSVPMKDWLVKLAEDTGTADFHKSAFSPESRTVLAKMLAEGGVQRLDKLKKQKLAEEYQNPIDMRYTSLYNSLVRTKFVDSDGLINTPEVMDALSHDLSSYKQREGVDLPVPEYLTKSIRKTESLIGDLVDAMAANKAIVPIYKKKSGVMPDRQLPWINIQDHPDIPYKESGWYAWSPHNKFGRFAPKDNPAIDMMEAWMSYQKNLQNFRSWSKDVLDGIPDASKEILAAVKPLFEKYQDTISYWNEYESGLERLRPEIAAVSGKLKAHKYNTKEIDRLTEELDYISTHAWDLFANPQDFTEAVNKINRQLNTVAQKMAKMKTKPEYGNLLNLLADQYAIEVNKQRLLHPLSELAKEHKLAMENLAKDHADVQMYLESEKGNTPLSQYMEGVRNRMTDLGIPMLREQGYMPRLWKELMSDPMANFMGVNLSSLKGVQWASREGNFKVDKVPSLLKFMSRVPGSVAWIPSAHLAMRSYIPIAEKKMAYQPFLNRWNMSLPTMERQIPKTKAYFDKFVSKNLYRDPINMMGRVTDAWVGMEYARLIGISTKVGFKHLLKLANTPVMYGFGASSYGLAKTLSLPLQAAARALGIKGDYKDLQLYQSYVTNAAIVRTFDENPYMSRAGMIFRTVIGTPVNVVEMFDNGVSLFAGMMRSANKDLKIENIRAGIWEGILDANFRGVHDSPLWLKSSLGRMAGMFQQTPLKLLEFKMKILSNLFDRNDSWNPADWKWKKDQFDSYYGAKAIRMIMMIGAAEMIARQNDTSVLEMFLHIPFVRGIIHPVRSGEGTFGSGYSFNMPKIAYPPPLMMASRMGEKGIAKGLQEHFKQMGMATTIGRIYKGNIPKMYANSPAQYLMGLPSLDAPSYEGGSPDQSINDYISEMFYGKQLKGKKKNPFSTGSSGGRKNPFRSSNTF